MMTISNMSSEDSMAPLSVCDSITSSTDGCDVVVKIALIGDEQVGLNGLYLCSRFACLSILS